jgi:ribosomal protein L40E
MGPTTDAWIDGTDLIVDLRVRKMWEPDIEDVLNAQMPLGGSIEGTALKTIFQKSYDGIKVLKKEIIDDLELYAGALTTIPAAWNLRGTAKSKSLSNNSVPTMCSQIMKSLNINSEGGDTIKKSVISVSDAFETIQAEINEALDDKYGTKTDWGVQRDCYIAYTTPDFVVISTYDGDMFQIPYTRADNGKGDIDVTLADPVPADLQLITKALNESEWMVKSIKPDKGGNILTDKIPEGMDKTFVEQVKGLKDEGKDFIKSILGIEDTELKKAVCTSCGASMKKDAKECPDCGESVSKSLEVNSPTGGTTMEKDVMTKEVVQKMIKEETGELQKTVTNLTEENESLKKRLDKSDEKTVKKTNKELLSKSLDLHKKLDKDMTPEQESDLVKEIKADLEKDHGSELVERDIKAMTKAVEKIPAHELPFTGSKVQKELSDKYAQQAAEGRAKIEKMGTK